RHHRRPGLLLTRQRRQLAGHRRTSATGTVGGSADTLMNSDVDPGMNTGVSTGLPMTVRVILPGQLQDLARCPACVELEVTSPVTQRSLLAALEARYPEL